MADTVALTVYDSAVTVNVTLSGGIQSTGQSLSDMSDVIDGFLVVKGSGNTAATIEVGDKIQGWLSDTKFCAGVVTALPYTTDTNRTDAILTEI